MTGPQRLHARAIMDELYRLRGRFGYPPGDQRDNRDGWSWHLSETEMLRALEGLDHGELPQLDCSETWSWVLRCCGVWHWSAPGWTGSHLATIRPVYFDARQAGIAAGVVFGGYPHPTLEDPATGHHEAMVHTPDPVNGNPLLYSHGHAGGDLARLHDMAAEQAASGHPGVRFLSVAHL